MRIVWNERSSRWFHNASEYTGYNRNLAKLLMQHIPNRGTLCDMGCGAALIDLELAPHFEQITCVDISPVILEFVDADIKRLRLQNVKTICMDDGQIAGQWDTVIALFHGSGSEVLKFLPMVNDQLIVATHKSRIGDFGPKGNKVIKCIDAQSTEDEFKQAGIRYHMTDIELEYGQPLESLEEAAEFIRAYTSPMEDSILKAYMDEHLECTGREDFPYYLPKKKRFVLFVIKKDENES